MDKLADGTPLNIAVYRGFRKAGLSDSQAKALTAEVGRENSFRASVLFGNHTDPAADKKGRAIRNVGMLSWNQGRDRKVLDFMQQRGALNKDGSLPRTQANIDAQAAYAVSEMRGDYKNRLKNFWANPNADPETYAKEVGKYYIGWAYGQDTVRGKGGKRVPFNWQKQDQHRRSQLNSLTQALGGKVPDMQPSTSPTYTPALPEVRPPYIPQTHSLLPVTASSYDSGSGDILGAGRTTPQDFLSNTVKSNAYTEPDKPTPVVSVNGNLVAPENKQEFDLFNGIIDSGLSPEQESQAVLATDKLQAATQKLRSQSLIDEGPLFGQLSNLFDMVQVNGKQTG